MQKVIDVLIKTKDTNGHVRHLGMADIEIDSIVIKQNVRDEKIIKEKSKASATAKKEATNKPKPESKTTKKTTTKKIK